MKNNIDSAIQLLNELPGISKKMAEKLSFALVENKNYLENMNKTIHLINNLEEDVETGLIIEKGEIANENRNKDILMIVESNREFWNIINKSVENNSYYILGTNNIKNFKLIQREIHKMLDIALKYKTKEIIFLMSPSIETELIVRITKEEISNKNIKMKLSRLSMGIPFGGSIEYSDERTIREAMIKREKI